MSSTNIINRQLWAFRQLSPTARTLLVSSFCYTIADLLVFTFAHAYLFTSTDSFYSVIFFNLGFFIILPIAFFANAFLLRRFSLKSLFATGLIGQGLIMSTLVFIPSLTLPTIFLFGLIFGFPMGLYWANRNFVMMADIPDQQRNYVSGMDGAFAEGMSVLLPFVAGWFIVFSAESGLLAKAGAYQVIMILGAIAFTLAALVIKRAHVTTPVIHSMSLRNMPKDWQVMRVFVLFAGIQMAIFSILPEMLILRNLGEEGTLGSVKALLALFTIILLYWVGKKTKSSDRYQILVISIFPLLIGGGLLLVGFSTLTVTLYLLLQSVTGALFYFVYNPVLAQVVERQDHGLAAQNYRYILDHEVVINLGRVITVIVMVGLLLNISEDLAITISIILVGVSQIGMLVAAKRLLKKV